MELNPLTYALLAQDAYTSIPQIGDESSAARAIIESTIDGTAFAFPGTNNVACWLADLDCAVTLTELGRLHKGFNDAALAIRAAVEAKAATVPPPIILVGHSEGAALALVLAGYLCLAGRPPRAVFAFEPPRVSADAKLGELLRQHGVRLFLFAKGNDIVPMVPRLLFPWAHPAPLTQIGTAAEPFPNVADHLMAGVVEAVRATVA